MTVRIHFLKICYYASKYTVSRQSSIVQSSTKLHLRKMEDIKIKFGQRVKELRLAKGYSQEKLSEIPDLDRTYIPILLNK